MTSHEKSGFGWRRGTEILRAIAAWSWFIFAGGSGLWLIITMGPWPPTNGWFVLFSGLAASPVTAWACKKYLGVTLSGRVRLGATALFILAGRLAVTFVWPRPGQPVNRPDWVAIVSGIIVLYTALRGARSLQP
jgi:hypothetical protein